MLYWFALALFGFCTLRLFDVFGGWDYCMKCLFGSVFSGRGLFNLLLILSFFGIVFFYNLVDVVLLKSVTPEQHVLAGVLVFIGIWLLISAYHPSNIPRYVGNAFALGVAVLALANTLVSSDLVGTMCFGALTICFAIEWWVGHYVFIRRCGWLNEGVCFMLAAVVYWLLFDWFDVLTWVGLL